MRSTKEATIDDLYRVRGKAEIVQGRLVRMTPAGGLHGYAVGAVYRSLHAHACRTKRGHALPDNVGFIVDLPGRRSFCPDAAFHVGPLSAGFIDGAPVFAVEVRSKGEYGPKAEARMAAKRAEYFAAGTLVVWDVDLLRHRVVRVYRASEPAAPTVYRPGEVAEAEPAVPGWSMPVDELFPVDT
jgi:Uma2 family endonuclease